MATKVKHTRRGWKLDQSKISSKPHEIEYVRLIFYKPTPTKNGNTTLLPFFHPSVNSIKDLIKKHNNSRRKVYAELKADGWKRIMKPKAK